MARYTGPKNKLARKIGADLNLKTSPLKVARRIMSRPGQHGLKGRRKLSDFGIQLREKQKVKYIYGVLENQLRRLYKDASKNPTATGVALLSLLERRLDNVVYRLKWAPTRASARQLVAHGHIKVNNKKVSASSYRVQVNDVISIRDQALSIPFITEAVKADDATVAWLEKKKAVAKVAKLPEREDITDNIEEQMIVEFYSR